jgi:hypothetical protein
VSAICSPTPLNSISAGNYRTKLGINDAQRTENALRGAQA